MPQVTSNLFHLIAKFRSFVSDFLFLLHDEKFSEKAKKLNVYLYCNRREAKEEEIEKK
jgi:hypothetical protein